MALVKIFWTSSNSSNALKTPTICSLWSLLKFIKESDITILDRVNYTKEDRKSWIDNTLLSSKQCLCVYLSTPKFVCIQRTKNRENQPTIKKGGGERIINDIDSKFEIPTKDEGFSDVINLEDEEGFK